MKLEIRYREAVEQASSAENRQDIETAMTNLNLLAELLDGELADEQMMSGIEHWLDDLNSRLEKLPADESKKD